MVLPGSAALLTGSPGTRGALGLGYVDLARRLAVQSWLLGRTRATLPPGGSATDK